MLLVPQQVPVPILQSCPIPCLCLAHTLTLLCMLSHGYWGADEGDEDLEMVSPGACRLTRSQNADQLPPAMSPPVFRFWRYLCSRVTGEHSVVAETRMQLSMS